MVASFLHASQDGAPFWLFIAAGAVLLLALGLVVWSAIQPDLEESFKIAARPAASPEDDGPMTA
jgi:hypothetical protein